MMSTIIYISHIQVVFKTIELKLFHLSQPRLRLKLDSQRLMLCLLQVSDILIKLKVKSMVSCNQEYKLTTSLVNTTFHYLQLSKKLRFSMVPLKKLKTSPLPVNSNLFMAECLL